MASTKPPKRGAYTKVLSFIFARWRLQPWRVAAMFALFMFATLLDVISLPSGATGGWEFNHDRRHI